MLLPWLMFFCITMLSLVVCKKDKPNSPCKKSIPKSKSDSRSSIEIVGLTKEKTTTSHTPTTTATSTRSREKSNKNEFKFDACPASEQEAPTTDLSRQRGAQSAAGQCHSEQAAAEEAKPRDAEATEDANTVSLS